MTRILIVEHDPHDLELLEYELKSGGIDYVSEIVQSEEPYRNALINFLPDIVLSDFSLPSFDGPGAFRIREELAPETPFIFVSGNIGEENAVEYIKNGVTDYVLKDKLFTLVSKFKRALRESSERRQKHWVEQERIQSEFRLNEAQSVAHMGSWEIGLDLNTHHWSDAMFTIFGTNRGGVSPSTESFLGFVHPDDLEEVKEKVDVAFRTVSESSYFFRFIRKDGAVRHGFIKSHFEFDQNKRPFRRHGILQDVTEKRNDDDKIRKANRLYAFISQVNQSIVHVKEEKELFRNACRIAFELGGFKMAWVGLFGSKHGIRVADQAGLPEAEIGRVNSTPYVKNGPEDHVLRLRTPFISNDVEQEATLKTWAPFAKVHGIGAIMVLPIVISGKVQGTFNLYAGAPDFFDTQEINLLTEATGDISFALEILEKAKVHRETEALVLKNEKRFRSLIENGTDLIAIQSTEGKIAYVSPSVAALTGYSFGELLRTSVFDLVHPDDAEELRRQTQSILQIPGATTLLQLRYHHKSEDWIWCEGTITNMMQEPGIHGLVSNFRDISEKKSAEQRQVFDKNNLDALLNTTNDMMWSVDRDFRLITSNHAFDEVVNQMSGQAVAKGSLILETGFSGPQLQRFKSYYERAFSGEAFTEIEHSGEPYNTWSEISYYPIYKERNVVGTACFSRNVTEQKKAETHLRLMESVITHTTDAVLITEEPVDRLGQKIIFVNKAFTKMTGYTSDEVLGKTPRFLQGPKSDRAQLDLVGQGLRNRMSVEVEILNYTKSGEEFWNNFAVVPLMDPEGNCTHCVSVQRDVTSRRLQEETTRKKLECLVADRTLELNEALKTEKEVVEMKNKFVSIASHEFRTPLSTISFAAESIRHYFHQLTSEEIQRKLIKIEDQASHMTNLLEDILTLGKSEAGKIKVKRISLDLKEFIDSLIDEVRATMKEKRVIDFTFSCAKRIVNADDKLLRNVFTNLISNALKFSSPDTIVTVDVSDRDGSVMMEVTDEGIGIEESELSSVFESFQRGSNVSTVQGTGLGLSILKKAVELMGGSIEVKSKLNQGSRFSVLIPIR